jgi:hypothetical protein
MFFYGIYLDLIFYFFQRINKERETRTPKSILFNMLFLMWSQVAIAAVFMATPAVSLSETMAFMEQWDQIMRGFIPDD